MGKAASEDQEVLGRLRKRSQNSDLHGDYQLLPGVHCPSQDEARDVSL